MFRNSDSVLLTLSVLAVRTCIGQSFRRHAELNDSCATVTLLKTKEQATCFCDEQCHLFDECCFDAPKSSYEPVGGRKPVTCTATQVLRQGEPATTNNTYMVSSCPEEFSGTEIKRRCEMNTSIVFDHVPVEDATYVYKNYYCALCHGAEILRFWKVELFRKGCGDNVRSNNSLDLKIMEKLVLTFAMVPPDCYAMSVQAPVASVSRRCEPQLINYCENRSVDEETLRGCESGPAAYRRIECRTFKNQFCGRCKHSKECPRSSPSPSPSPSSSFSMSFGFNRPTSSFRMPLDFNHPQPRMPAEYRREFDLFSMSHLFELDLRREKCDFPQHYDPLEVRCRFFFCGESSLLVGRHCIIVQSNLSCHTTMNISLLTSRIENDGRLASLELGHDAKWSPGEYSLIGETQVIVCVAKVADSDMFSSALISLIGGSLSCLTIVIYLSMLACNHTMRPRNLTMHVPFLFSLLVGQTAYLFRRLVISWRAECYLVAFAVHYFLLSSFLWSSTLSFDLNQRIRSLSSMLQKKSRKTLVGYHLFCWLIALISPLLAIGVDLDWFATDDMWKPRFEVQCWFSRARPLLVFFAVPVSASLLFNMINWVWFQVQMRQSRISAKNQSLAAKDIGVAAKLGVFLGFPWVLGFVAPFVSQEWFWCVFALFTSLQGVFITIILLLAAKKGNIRPSSVAINNMSA